MCRRFAVISDIHSNWHALRRVLDDIDASDVEDVWCLGDLVGYGPDPLRCWQELAENRALALTGWVAGNHDWGLVGKLESRFFVDLLKDFNGPVGDFGPDAWDVLLKQHTVLSARVFEHLGTLPLLASPVSHVYLAHASYSEDPRMIIGHYAKVPTDAEDSLTSLRAMLGRLVDAKWQDVSRQVGEEWLSPRLMLVGHTHRVCAFQPRDGEIDGSRWLDRSQELENCTVWFEQIEHQPVFANPGSVGFPNDSAPGHATYLIVDWQETRVGLTLRRLSYDPCPVIEAMQQAGTPSSVMRRIDPGNCPKASRR